MGGRLGGPLQSANRAGTSTLGSGGNCSHTMLHACFPNFTMQSALLLIHFVHSNTVYRGERLMAFTPVHSLAMYKDAVHSVGYCLYITGVTLGYDTPSRYLASTEHL